MCFKPLKLTWKLDCKLRKTEHCKVFRVVGNYNYIQRTGLLGRLHFIKLYFFIFLWRCGPTRAMAPSSLRFLYHTQRRITQSVGLLWTSDQPVAETSTSQHTTFTTDIHAPGGIRTHNLSKRAAADPRLRPRGHWDRLWSLLQFSYSLYWIKLQKTDWRLAKFQLNISHRGWRK